MTAGRVEADGSVDRLQHRWVDLARTGDENAFAALVRQHQDQLYRVALRMVGDSQDAQDVVQDAFLQAWQHLPGFRGQAQFSTWITRILLNRCANVIRARRPAGPLPESDAEPRLPRTPSAEAVAVAAQRRDAVRSAVSSLPDHHRVPLVLSTFGGYSYAETGRILGISEGAAKVRAHRARRALAQVLQEWR